MGSNPAIAHKPLHADVPIRDVVLAVAVALVLSGCNASNPKPITNYSPKGAAALGFIPEPAPAPPAAAGTSPGAQRNGVAATHAAGERRG